MQRTLKEIYEQVQELVKSSPVHPHLRQDLPEYEPGPYGTDINLKFGLNGGRGEKCRIDIRFSHNREEAVVKKQVGNLKRGETFKLDEDSEKTYTLGYKRDIGHRTIDGVSQLVYNLFSEDSDAVGNEVGLITDMGELQTVEVVEDE